MLYFRGGRNVVTEKLVGNCAFPKHKIDEVSQTTKIHFSSDFISVCRMGTQISPVSSHKSFNVLGAPKQMSNILFHHLGSYFSQENHQTVSQRAGRENVVAEKLVGNCAFPKHKIHEVSQTAKIHFNKFPSDMTRV